MRNFVAKALVLFVFVFAALTQLKAQTMASITGTVTDPTGAVIPDVNVTLTNPLTNDSYQGVSNAIGSYLILHVKPGPGYKMTFAHDGFQSTTVTDMYMNVGATRTQNAQLTIGGESQTVMVSAASQDVTLDTIDATVGNNFQVQFMNNLPVANRDSPTALFYMQPGVNLAGSVSGSRTDQLSTTVDGLDVNDMATGNFTGVVASAPVDSIQEFRGTTAGMTTSASMGGGGHFDMVTKSGSNAFHGSVVEYHRDTNLTANDWFNNNAHVGRAPLIRNQFGGQVGGPIKHDKAFFYFDYDARRDVRSSLITRTVPTTTFKAKQIAYGSATGTKYLSAADVQSMDPSGHGFNQAIIDLFNKRYPDPNSTAAGNGLTTSGFRFNAPAPYNETVYVSRLDYNLTDKMKLFGRFTINRTNATQSAIQFPKDPDTFPFIDRSRAWVAGNTWTINSHMNNNVSWGQTVADYSFGNNYNPQGDTQFTFGTTSSGGTILSQPYPSAVNAQSRTYPIPVLKDDFNWIKGRHSFQIGGTFKYINPDFTTKLNYNQPTVGMGGFLSAGLAAGQRPADITSSTASYDAAFTTALGHYATQTSTYNYDSSGTALKQGSGLTHHYRYYEMELYFEDTWKVTSDLSVNYGLAWTNYSTPYDKNGIESAPSLDFETYYKDRLAQAKVGNYGDTVVPFISYNLSGKGNGKPGLFNSTPHNFGPHVGFTFTPSFDKKSVFSAGIGIDYDRTVIAALLYQQAQYSYLFQAGNSAKYGSNAGAAASLTGDQRFAGIGSAAIAPPPAPAITKPYLPWATDAQCNPNGYTPPCGLAIGGVSQFNETVDKNFKTPYSINLSAGFQHEFPKGFLLKMNYAGRLGRRLMAQADVNQLIDFPDTTSGQLMSSAFAGIEKELRQGIAWNHLTPQPWFENLVYNPYAPTYSATSVMANPGIFGYLFQIGDFADTIEAMNGNGFLPNNIGMGAQFAEFTYYTNKGSSNYHGLLTTLHKNAGYGLQFDINYTLSKSIDNVSASSAVIAYGGYGFICDVQRPRECRAPSDFDNRQVINGDIIYDLPFGRGRSYGANMSKWEDEFVGGWQISVLPTWRTGFPYFAYSNAFVAGYADDAPAVLTGSLTTMKPSPHKDASGKVWLYGDTTKALNSYTGLTGFDIGSRNNLYGVHYANFDLGLGKTFPIYHDRTTLQFRCDAFNAFNHPTFSDLSSSNRDITETSASFGQITSTTSAPRVLQGSLRLEF